MDQTKQPSKWVEKVVDFLAKASTQVHLCSIRDAIATLMPFYILAGLVVLLNCVVFNNLLHGETLTRAQDWANAICNGTLNISGFLIAPVIAFCFARNKNFSNPLAALVAAVGAFIIMMPKQVMVTPVGTDSAVSLIGVLTYNQLGTSSMFAGIIIGLAATALFLRLTQIKQLKISLGNQVPPPRCSQFF